VEYERGLVVRTAGSLPVVATLAERLGLVEAVDRFCPIRSVADYTHGQVVLALVANRLSHPRPLSSFIDWGEQYAVAETLGIEPGKLNDDRLGRTLDALAERLDEVLNLVARRAIERFGISIAELHWDLTHLAFSGSYAEQDGEHPRVRKGRTPEQTIVRQVRTGLLVTDDGAVPLLAKSFDGSSNDVITVEPALERLDALREALPATGEPPLVVGDSKLLSAGNVRAFETRGLRFVCPHPKDAPMKRRLAARDDAQLVPLGYRPQRQRQPEPRYFAGEDSLSIGGSELRALYVLSLDDRDAARAQREKQLARAEDELGKLNRGVPTLKRSPEEVERRARAILERRRVQQLTRLTLSNDTQPQARLERDQQAIAEAERLDGRYCLVSNDDQLTSDELFAAYKRQHLVEGRFADFKGPLAVRPVFLHNNKRINALVAVTSLALLLYGLIERAVRQGLSALARDQQRLLQQRIGRATGRKILEQLSTLTAVRVRDGPLRLAEPRPAQQLLLQLLQI
jgi:transposase